MTESSADHLNRSERERSDRIDRLCDRFEATWRRGRGASLESFLAEARPEDRPDLLAALLESELELRAAVEDRPTQETYQARFPGAGDASTIASVFQKLEGRAARTATHTGRFRIEKLLANGGTGLVFRAYDLQLHRHVALKQLQPQAATPENQRRLEFEAYITGQLDHPGVVPVYCVEHWSDGDPFYCMKLVEEKTLRAAIDELHADGLWRSRPWRKNRQLRALLARFIAVCQTVAFAHSRGIIHRDIAPRNILLGDFGATWLVDWGSAKQLSPPAEASIAMDSALEPGHEEVADLPRTSDTLPCFGGQSDRSEPAQAWKNRSEPGFLDATGQSVPTIQGLVLGTPGYFSPEQAAGGSQVGPASDIYSLGAALYHLLVGRPAFDIHTTQETLIVHVSNGQFTRPRVVWPGVPSGLEAVCLNAMATDPDQRYASPKELADDVQSWLDDEPVTALRESAWTRSRRWLRKRGERVSTVSVLLAALAVVVTIFAVWRF